MSDRIRYLVCYDIREEKRLRRVHRTMLGWGEHVQYSVFVCDLTVRELIGMRVALAETIDHRDDSVMVVRLGATSDSAFEFLGTPLRLPEGGARII